MLVDDDNSNRMQGRAILKDLYEVYPLSSAYKLFEVLELFLPDLILLDIKMPVIDGFQALRQIKSNERYAHIPVIFLTALNDKESVIKGSALGVAGFVTKPFTGSELVEHIEKCLNPSGGNEAEDNNYSETSSTKRIVLAVDDAPDILRTIHSMLHVKYKVYTLPKPEKLSKLLRDITPDLFLIDYKMPSISGFDLISVIREFPEHKETPVIFLTSEGTFDNISTAVDLGACDFIAKPFEMDVLRGKIERHI
jgi:DNA-binding response OmpR family regulator